MPTSTGETLRLARRCVLDRLAVAVALAGTDQPGIKPLGAYVESLGGTPQARLIGRAASRVPAHLAALWDGTADHAMDWDGHAACRGSGPRPYGLLMHPTVPPLIAALTMSDLVAAK